MKHPRSGSAARPSRFAPFAPSKGRQPVLALLGLALWACTSACSGGGPSGADAGDKSLDEIDNSGSFSEDDFDYEDTSPPGSHPMGLETAVLTRFEELAILTQPFVAEGAQRVTLFDDIGAGAGVLGFVPDIAGSGVYVTTAAGLVDDDGADELVVVRRGDSGSLDVLTIEPDQAGDYGVPHSFNIPSAGFTYGDTQLVLADVDGDFRDEYLFATRDQTVDETASAGWVRVYDDNVQGNGLLYDLPLTGAHAPAGLDHLELAAGDLDGDGRDEIGVLALRRVGSSRTVQIQVFEEEAGAFVNRIPWGGIITGLDRNHSSIRLLCAELDGEGHEELVVGIYEARPSIPAGRGECRLIRYRVEEGNGSLTGSPSITMDRSVDGVGASGTPERMWDITAVDTNADGIDEVAVLLPESSFPFSGNGAEVVTVEWTGDAWQEGFTFRPISSSSALTATRLHATDDDGDGQDEAYLVWIAPLDFSAERKVARLDWGEASNPVTDTWSSNLVNGQPGFRPVIASPEIDCEGLTVRFTGNRFTSLADPMRLALLTAPPTKSGIDQNYAATSTRYSVATGAGQTYGLTAGVTASVYSGFEVSDLTDTFGASARQTVSGSLVKSQQVTQTETTVQGFSGPASEDAIVFQGTLYRSYEYEVIEAEDPAVVGTFYSLDVPVRTRVYKWSVDYFNSAVAPEYRIGSDLLPHTVGDPTSYRTIQQAAALGDRYVSWRTGDAPPATVGQSSGSTDVAIRLASESTTSEERTLDVTWEAGFTVAGTQAGGSFGVTTSSIYSVSVSEESTYEGVIGDIAPVDQYEQWAYDFGLVVYHHGLLSDSNNQPTGSEADTVPFQVLTYWTRPFGTGY